MTTDIRAVPHITVDWVDPALKFAFDCTDQWAEPPDLDTVAALVSVFHACEQCQREVVP